MYISKYIHFINDPSNSTSVNSYTRKVFFNPNAATAHAVFGDLRSGLRRFPMCVDEEVGVRRLDRRRERALVSMLLLSEPACVDGKAKSDHERSVVDERSEFAKCRMCGCGIRRLKDFLRNSTGQERLTGLALLSVHREINIDIEEVVNRFSREKTSLSFKINNFYLLLF